MELPFDVHNEDLMEQFLIYADEVFNMKNSSFLSLRPPSMLLGITSCIIRR